MLKNAWFIKYTAQCINLCIPYNAWTKQNFGLAEVKVYREFQKKVYSNEHFWTKNVVLYEGSYSTLRVQFTD